MAVENNESHVNPILSAFTRDANRFSNRDLAQNIADLKSGTDNISGVGLGTVQSYNATYNTADVLLESGDVSTLDNGLGIAVAENDRVVYSLYKGSKINGAIVGIIDLANFGGGGSGSSVYLATVNSSTAQFLTGNATLSIGGSISFVNATSSFLVSGDEIIVADVVAYGYAAVGIVSKIAGTTTVIPQPITSLSTAFPIRTDNLTFPILGRIFYDYNNDLNQTGDSIYDETSLNALTIPTSTNFNLFAPYFTTTTSHMFLQSNGRLINIPYLSRSSGISSANIEIAYRDLGDPSWTYWTPSVIPTTNNRVSYAFDETNGAFWGFFGGDAIRFLPSDSAPVELSSFYSLIGTVNPGTARNTAVSTDNGILYIHADGSTMSDAILYYKPSGNSNALTNTGVISNMKDNPSGIDLNDNLYYLQENTVTNTYHIIKFNHPTGPVVDYDTGIPYASSGFDIRISTIEVLDSGIILLGGAAKENFLGISSSTDFIPVIASFNFITTNYIYYDDTYFTPRVSAFVIRDLKEVVPGTVRFLADGGSSNTWVYELTGF
jgi:hypothetical protein